MVWAYLLSSSDLRLPLQLHDSTWFLLRESGTCDLERQHLRAAMGGSAPNNEHQDFLNPLNSCTLDLIPRRTTH